MELSKAGYTSDLNKKHQSFKERIDVVLLTFTSSEDIEVRKPYIISLNLRNINSLLFDVRK